MAIGRGCFEHTSMGFQSIKPTTIVSGPVCASCIHLFGRKISSSDFSFCCWYLHMSVVAISTCVMKTIY